MSALEDAYEAVRAHQHSQHVDDEQTREELRSLLWIVAEAVERYGRSGMPLQEIGDELTGATMSPTLRAMLQRS